MQIISKRCPSHEDIKLLQVHGAWRWLCGLERGHTPPFLMTGHVRQINTFEVHLFTPVNKRQA
jgi:transposase